MAPTVELLVPKSSPQYIRFTRVWRRSRGWVSVFLGGVWWIVKALINDTKINAKGQGDSV
jgi:hypothetical protein